MTNVKTADQQRVANFIAAVYALYKDLFFTYLEVNPLVVKTDGIYVLDLAAKIDQTAEYLCSSKWGKIGFPPPFGREAFPEVCLPLIIYYSIYILFFITYHKIFFSSKLTFKFFFVY